MICYKDMTFCTFWKLCKDGEGCHRALTDEIKENSWNWWNQRRAIPEVPPICVFSTKPDCFKQEIK